MRILLAKDDPLIGNGLRLGLRREGFAALPYDRSRRVQSREHGALAAVPLVMCSQAPQPQTHGG
ncbi:DNA-binding response OmpR family regulator [Paraburkholderia youngii]